MKPINSKKEISGDLERVIQEITERLKEQGFGILTRIDLHSKIREKLGKEMRPAVILGACNPQLAYEAYQANTDVASLLPCNVVIREIENQRYSVEAALPSAMMEILDDPGLVRLAKSADLKIATALDALGSRAA